MCYVRHGMAAFILIVATVLGMSTAIAQGDPTPTPTLPATPAEQQATAQAALNYPVAVHQGTCQSPTAQPAFELGNAAPVGEGVDGAEVIGTAVVPPVVQASGSIDLGLQDVVNGTHVIAVHSSPETFGEIIACGTIAGTLADGKLVVAVLPVGESTLSGVAVFEEGDQTNVTVYMTSHGPEGAFPTPAVTPTPLS